MLQLLIDWMFCLTIVRRFSILCSIFFFGIVHAQSAEQRIALVVGNGRYTSLERGDYPGGDEMMPINDADLMARRLSSAGFELIGGKPWANLNKVAFEKEIQDFTRSAQVADFAVFYYSGHALQSDGENWLIPTDAHLGQLNDLNIDMIKLASILTQLRSLKSKESLVIIEACRDNPFDNAKLRLSRSYARRLIPGLAAVSGFPDIFVALAAAPNRLAFAEAGLRRSRYTDALADAMLDTRSSVNDTFKTVAATVAKQTNGRQMPWTSTVRLPEELRFFYPISPPIVPSGRVTQKDISVGPRDDPYQILESQ